MGLSGVIAAIWRGYFAKRDPFLRGRSLRGRKEAYGSDPNVMLGVRWLGRHGTA